MTEEQLDMIKRLQPFFKERMGDWQESDQYYSEKYKELSYVHFVFHLKKFVADETALHIPKVYDWQNPERGLWGMVDWKAYTFDIKHDGTVFLNKRSLTLQIDCISIGDIFTALLKALCEQGEYDQRR